MWYLKLELVGFNVGFEVVIVFVTGVVSVVVVVVVVAGRLVDSVAFVGAVKNKYYIIRKIREKCSDFRGIPEQTTMEKSKKAIQMSTLIITL